MYPGGEADFVAYDNCVICSERYTDCNGADRVSVETASLLALVGSRRGRPAPIPRQSRSTAPRWRRRLVPLTLRRTRHRWGRHVFPPPRRNGQDAQTRVLDQTTRLEPGPH